jgi:hypothetical protein
MAGSGSRLAAQKLAQEKPGQTLNATALVHEDYLLLVGTGDEPPWHSRGHFFARRHEFFRPIVESRFGGALVRQPLPVP